MSLLIGLVLCAFGSILVISGVRRLVTAVSLYRNEAIPVRNVAKSEDPVEFDGRAEPRADDGAFEAPFSGEPALCCEVWLETQSQHRTDAEGLELLGPDEPATQRNTRNTWLLAERDEIRRPFVVEEGGSRVELDPAGASLDITGHMGEVVSTVAPGESLPEDVRERLRTLDRMDVGFDCNPETWERENDRVQYREARLEPGDGVHVADGAVESVPEEWGSGISATVGSSGTGEQLRISEGSESTVVRTNVVQFVTGVVIGLVLFGLGLHALGIRGLL